MTDNRLKKLPTYALAALYRETYTKMKEAYANLSDETVGEAVKLASACATFKKELKTRKNKR